MYSSIPLKNTSKADISSCLLSYAKKNLSIDSNRTLKELLKSAEEGRKQLVNLTCYESDMSISETIEYYCFVAQIVDSFPVAEESPVGIQVKWSDIYRKNATSTYNFSYEKACVLFDIGALHSQKAFKFTSSMENLGDVQSVINEYKEAANCFLYIRQVLFSSYGPDNKTWDMSESALLGFENLCHALSQLAVAKKADLSGTKPYAKSAILFGCQKMFDDAAAAFESCNAPNSSWATLCHILSEFCLGNAYLYLAEYAKQRLETTSTGCGLLVGLGAEAEKVFRAILEKYRKTLSKTLSEMANDLVQKSHTTYVEGMKENRAYLEVQTPVSDFPQVEAKILHPLTEPDIPNIGPGSFEKMVPQYVVDALARYHSFAQGELDKLIQSIEGYNKQLEQVKESLHVDNVISAAKSRAGLPEEYWEQIQEIQENDGVQKLFSKLHSMNSLSSEVTTNMQQLQQEMGELQRPGSPPLSSALSQIMVELNKYMGYLGEAMSGEEKVNDQVQKVTENRSFLESSRGDLEAQLPSQDLSGNAQVALEQLQKAVGDIDNILETRRQKINELVAMEKDDSKIRDELILEKGSGDERGIFTRNFNIIKDKFHELELSLQCQNTYVSALQQRFEEFNMAMKSEPSYMQRQSMLINISRTIEAFNNATNFITEGTAFYEKLDSNYKQLRARFDKEKKSVSPGLGSPKRSFPPASGSPPPQVPGGYYYDKNDSQFPAYQPQPQPYQPQQPQPYQQQPQQQPPFQPQPYQQQQPFQPQPYQPPQSYQPQQPQPPQQPQLYQPYSYYQPPQQPYAPYASSYTQNGAPGYQYGNPGMKQCKYCHNVNDPSQTNCNTCGKLL